LFEALTGFKLAAEFVPPLLSANGAKEYNPRTDLYKSNDINIVSLEKV
jgi:hypothetical protein